MDMEKIVAFSSWFAGAAIGHYLLGLGVHEAFTVAGIGLIIWFLTERVEQQ